VIISGTFINVRFTKRIPLIAGWLGGFMAQAFMRSFVFDTPVAAPLMPMTGFAFILYTFYMVTDPATTPSGARGQVAFGVSVAAVYGLLMVLHVVFGLFFALTVVCALRGLGLYAHALLTRKVRAKIPVQAPAVVVRPEA